MIKAVLEKILQIIVSVLFVLMPFIIGYFEMIL